MMPGPPNPPPGPPGSPPPYPAPQAGPGYPTYPGYPPPGPPPRRNRATLFVVLSVVVFVVAAATVTGVYLATAGSDDTASSDTASSDTDSSDTGDDASGETGGAAGEPAVTLPAGCELLSRDQFQVFVPGELDAPQETGPQDWDDGATTMVSCAWWNIPVYGEVPQAGLRAEAYASTAEDLAKKNMSTPIGTCGEDRREVQATTVPGADEACLIHGEQVVETGEFVGSVDVVARRGTVVVKIYYNHSEAMIDEIDMAAETMASAALSTIGEAK